MPGCPHRVEVVVGGLGQVAIVLPHAGHGAHQRDVVPLPAVAARRLVVRERVAVVPCNTSILIKFKKW